jgi:formylmethanofuran dehydrogenase subunit D
MKLQKHITKKGKKYFKWEVILPAEDVEKAGFEEGDELTTKSKKGEIRLKKAV